MAQSKNFFNDIKKELECPVCQEQFSETNEPKVLKCQHTFCKSCLDGWLRQQGGGRLSCPNCRELTECPNNNIDCLPTNLACKNLGDILKAHDGSDGGRDFRSQRENVCKRHKKKVEYYCEQCEICICSGCVIVEHRDSNDHTIVSLEDGVRKQKAIIEGKIKDVAANTTRLRSDIATLVERRKKFNSSIEQVANEVHRVAGDCINLIRQHEASVTEQLAMEKSLYDDDISKELSKLTEKLQRMDTVSTLGREVLKGENIEEMLNMKQVLHDAITEKATPLLKHPDLKYTPNALPRNFAPGKLYITHTEPSLSVAMGGGLTNGIQGYESNFIVTTMDSKGQTTYSEIDKVTVEIQSIQKAGTKNIPAVVKELKDGRYSVSFKPSAYGEFSVSIKVRDEPIRESPFKLLIDAKVEPAVEHEAGLDATQTDHMAFEVDPKFFKDLVKAHEAELNYIEAEYRVEIPREAKGGIVIQPKGGCTGKEYERACDLFVDMYQQMYQIMKMERFSLKSEKIITAAQQKIHDMDSASGRVSKEECAICLDTVKNARTLKCKHVFCTDCVETALTYDNRCPVCKEPHGVVQGNQPYGEMQVYKSRQSLPGYHGCGTITISYYFPPGIQGPEHPNPGRRYEATSRFAYLPDNQGGREVLELLRKAFDARLVFTVGTSVTTGRPNQITWNDIHHKTNTHGGPQGYGYPDPDYLRRVKEDLAAKGIR